MNATENTVATAPLLRRVPVVTTDEHVVKSLTWVSDGIFEIRLERGEITYSPGDCVALFAEDRIASRPYSIASGVEDDSLGFVIRHFEGGEVTGFLATRKPGDTVKVSPPFGWFKPGHPEHPRFCFIATGTGISPFLAHLRSFPDQPPEALLYGVRQASDAVGQEVLPQKGLHLAVSREDLEGAHRGRVTDLLDQLPLDDDIHYYLCGLDTMIDEVTIWLEAKGVAIPRIHRECFFNADVETA